MSELRKAVRDFMTKANQELPHEPRVPSDAIVRFRLRLIVEEVFELVDACLDLPQDARPWRGQIDLARAALDYAVDESPVKVDLIDAADGLGDIAFVVEGMAGALGIDSRVIIQEIARSNATKDFSGAGSAVKVTKGERYEPPNIAKALDSMRARRP